MQLEGFDCGQIYAETAPHSCVICSILLSTGSYPVVYLMSDNIQLVSQENTNFINKL